MWERTANCKLRLYFKLADLRPRCAESNCQFYSIPEKRAGITGLSSAPSARRVRCCGDRGSTLPSLLFHCSMRNFVPRSERVMVPALANSSACHKYHGWDV